MKQRRNCRVERPGGVLCPFSHENCHSQNQALAPWPPTALSLNPRLPNAVALPLYKDSRKIFLGKGRPVFAF